MCKTRRQLVCEGAAVASIAALGAWLRPDRGQAQSVDRPVVNTAEGRLRGVSTPKLNVFKGVRYAEDVSKNRFRPATPLRPWTGIRDADSLGAPCPQHNIDTLPWRDPQPESEDCLFLNVWSPKGAVRRPVMVWLHGGAFTWGSGGTPMYDGGNLAARGDVVVVTVNHRLNAFGYLYLAGLSPDFSDAVNLGQQDLVEALRWIGRNIAQFGGDPDNVTIFGESGGGGKVSTLLAMPSARGLFHRAIVQSGSLNRFASKDAATAKARQVLRQLGLGLTEVEKLREISPAQLVAACEMVGNVDKLHDFSDIPFAPVQDEATLPFQPHDAGALALWKDVPLLVGTTEQESVWFLTLNGPLPTPADDGAVETQVNAWDPRLGRRRTRALVAAYRRALPSASNQDLLLAITSGAIMWRESVRQAESKIVAGGAPAYMYLFSWKEPLLGRALAFHGDDVPFVFDKLELKDAYEDNSDTEALRAKLDTKGARFHVRDAVMEAWISFARRGDPNTPLLPHWPKYDLAHRATMRLDAAPVVMNDPFGPAVRNALAAADQI